MLTDSIRFFSFVVYQLVINQDMSFFQLVIRKNLNKYIGMGL